MSNVVRGKKRKTPKRKEYIYIYIYNCIYIYVYIIILQERYERSLLSCWISKNIAKLDLHSLIVSYFASSLVVAAV